MAMLSFHDATLFTTTTAMRACVQQQGLPPSLFLDAGGAATENGGARCAA